MLAIDQEPEQITLIAGLAAATCWKHVVNAARWWCQIPSEMTGTESTHMTQLPCEMKNR